MLTLLASAATTAALALTPLPTGHPELPCSRAPYGTTGCEAYLGAVVRRDHGLDLSNTTDYDLGRAIRLLCFGADHETLRSPSAELRHNLSMLDRIKRGYCG